MLQVNRSRSKQNVRPTCVTRSQHAVWNSWSGWRPISDPFWTREQQWTTNTSWSGTRSTILDHTGSNWRLRARRGQATFNDVLLTKEERTWSPGTLITNVPCGIREVFDGDFGPFLSTFWEPRAVLISDEERDYHLGLALVKAYAKMNAPDIVSGEYVAEFSKTVGMLRRPFSGAQKLLKKIYRTRTRLLKHKVVTASDITRASASAWLEHRYGWKPLMMDADHAIESIMSQFTDLNGCFRVARGSSKMNQYSSNNYSGTFPQDEHFHVEFVRSVTQQLRADAGVLYRLKDRTNFEKANAYLGIRPRDIPATLWELTPYSFVLDWFTNIGIWLQALTPNPDVEILGHWQTSVKTTITTEGNGTITHTDYMNQPTVSTGSTGSNTYIVTEFRRICNQDLTFNPLVPRLSLGPIQAISGLSLLLQGVLGSIKQLRH